MIYNEECTWCEESQTLSGQILMNTYDGNVPACNANTA